MQRLIVGLFFGICEIAAASASPVGERHLLGSEASAGLRDAKNSDQLRVTIWYPAAANAVEEPLDIGPPNQPLFRPGKAAQDAGFLDDRARPVILLSHGFGGTARIMAWFGIALAREGYVVVAVDHPGNNGRDQMTVAGATLFWERPGDLRAALTRVKADPAIAPPLDLARLGVSGFSAGGFTGLAAAGARVDVQRFRAFCVANPSDGICAPQKEFAVSRAQAAQFLGSPEAADELARSREDLSIEGVKAVFVMAPAIVQSLDPRAFRACRCRSISSPETPMRSQIRKPTHRSRPRQFRAPGSRSCPASATTISCRSARRPGTRRSRSARPRCLEARPTKPRSTRLYCSSARRSARLRDAWFTLRWPPRLKDERAFLSLRWRCR